MKSRHLKVAAQHRENLYRGRVTSTSVVPCLRLAGKWLEQAGFRSGQAVSVLVENGRLVITSKGKEVSI